MNNASVAVHATDDDISCASSDPTPRRPMAVKQLASRVLAGTMRAKHWAVWVAASFGLWMLGTAVALVITSLVPAWGNAPILVLGFGGLGVGLVSGYASAHRRRIAAHALARDGQLVTGIATYRRSQETLIGELGDLLVAPLGETRYCIALSIGFIRHELWVALPAPPADGDRHVVLVQPGARVALAFDASGRGHVGAMQLL